MDLIALEIRIKLEKDMFGNFIRKFCCPICGDDVVFYHGDWEDNENGVDYVVCETHSKESLKQYNKKNSQIDYLDNEIEVNMNGETRKYKNLKALWDDCYKLFETEKEIIYRAYMSGRVWRIRK